MRDDTATITGKGQITLPGGLRCRLGLKPGDRVQFVEQGSQPVVRKLPGSELRSGIGYLGTGERTDDVMSKMRNR